MSQIWMDRLADNLPWIVAGCTSLLALALLLRGRRPAPTVRDQSVSRERLEAARLRSRIQELEAEYVAHMDFIVNFPETVRSITAALSLEQVLSACSRGVTAMLMTRQIGIFLVQENSLLLADGAGFDPDFRGRLALPLHDNGLVALIENRTVADLADHPTVQVAFQKFDLTWDVAIPLWHGERLLGLLVVARPQGEAKMVRRVLAMLADLTAVGLNAASQVSQIRDEAERDALTGLANRRTLMKRAQLEVQRARSYGSCVSLAMVDVDHFKVYNDTHGHAAGDDVLRQVAQLLQANTRRTDLVARYGGEEFTIVLCGADREQALQHAERVREAVARHEFPGGKQQPLGQLSISLGLATFPTNSPTLSGVFEAADRGLYQAKEEGRNRVVVYRGPPVPGS